MKLGAGLCFSALLVLTKSFAQDGTTDVTFSSGTGANGTIRAMAIQPDGKIIIGGTFTSYNGTTVGRIARLNSDGTLDAGFGSGTGFSNASDSVLAIAVASDGGILVGGRFGTYDGTNITDHIVRLASWGSIDPSFTPVTLSGSATGSTTHVRAIAIQPDGAIIIAGDWTSTGGGNPYRRIVRLTTAGARDATYNSADAQAGVTSSSFVNSIAVQADGKIVIGGSFTSYNSVSANRIARLNSNGSRDGTFSSGSGAGVNSPVHKVAVLPDGDILIAGVFNTIGSPSRFHIARLNSDGTVDAAFDADVSSTITAMCIQPDGKIIIGGNFTTVSGQTVNRIARLNSDGTLDTSFNPGTGANDVIRALALRSDGKLMLSGGFTTYNGTATNRIIRVANTATPVSMRNSIVFDGVDDFITVDHHSDFNVSEFTFEAWIKAPSVINPGTYTLFSKEGATVDFRVSLVSNTAGSFDHIAFTSDIFGSSSTGDILATTFLWARPNEWHHIAVVVRGNIITYHSNGLFWIMGNLATAGTANNTYPIRIGSANGTNFWKGELDEVRFWNKGMLQVSGRNPMLEEWHHLELTATGTDRHDYFHALKGYWQFNQSETGTIYDYSIWPGLNLADRSCYSYKNGTPSAGMSTGYIQATTAPLGSIGTAARVDVTGAGTYSFANTNCQLAFAGSTVPNGIFVVTHVEHSPAGSLPDNIQIPGLLYRISDQYWIVENHDISTYTSTALDGTMTLTGIPGLDNSDTQLYLAERSSTSYGNWAVGSNAATGINNSTGQAVFGGITGFGDNPTGIAGSQFVPISQGLSTLPIELMKFSAAKKGNTVLLTWETAMELNNDHFIVMHSTDGKEFISLGRVEGNGTSQKVNNYSFVDRRPSPGKNYYRLYQYDYDGKETDLGIRFVAVEVVAEEKGIQISIYPNPARREVKIYSSHFVEKAVITFFDLLNGKQALKKELCPFGWEQTLEINPIDFGNLHSGLYRVVLSSEKGRALGNVLIIPDH